MSNALIGGTRALLGQGLGMGWGDEAEAWLRSKLSDEQYDAALKRIREEQAQFSKGHPFVSGLNEFAGGVIPGVAAAFVPGAQGAVPATGARTVGNLAALGAATGAIAGAGASEDPDRSSGTASGALLGAGMGAAAPIALRGAGAGLKFAKERVNPSDAFVSGRAAEKFSKALADSNMTPQQMERAMVQDRSAGVPSMTVNASSPVSKLGETVAQRSGEGARKMEEKLLEQRLGAKERTHQQVVKGLSPGNYYDDLDALQQSMRSKAAPLYQAAYARGVVQDPDVLKFMQLPQFQQGAKKAEELLAAEGRTVDMSQPTVEVLDQVKRGLDALIEGQTDAVTGKTTSLGRVFTQKKNEFLDALDKAVPEYAQARAVYRGDAELMDAMRTGMTKFKSMDHEQVVKHVAGLSDAEKAAFRTGVARDLYSKIMDSSGNFNAAQRIIGAPENQAKLQPLFANPGQFDLFKAALEREAQLFAQSNRVLGGSQTGQRMQMREEFEKGSGVGEAIGNAITGGFGSSLSGMVSKMISTSNMPEKTANKLASMLTAKDPAEVAAVVKLLEDYATQSAPKAFRAGAAESGLTTGAASAITPSAAPQSDRRETKRYNIEEEEQKPPVYNIEDDL